MNHRVNTYACRGMYQFKTMVVTKQPADAMNQFMHFVKIEVHDNMTGEDWMNNLFTSNLELLRKTNPGKIIRAENIMFTGFDLLDISPINENEALKE